MNNLIVENLTIEELFNIIYPELNNNKKLINYIKSILYSNAEPNLKIIKMFSRNENEYLFLKALIEISERFQKKHNFESYLKTPLQFYNFIKPYFIKNMREQMFSVYVNVKQKVLGVTLISIGSSDFAYIEFKDILRDAFFTNAKGIMLAHNHPSNEIEPSKEDINFTKKFSNFCEELGFILMDHLIVGNDRYLSLKEAGYY